MAAIVAGLGELADRQGDGKPVPQPRPPAPAEAIAEAERVRGVAFTDGYRRFLALHDGWPDFPWGLQLFGTEELVGDAYGWAQETFELSTDDSEVPEQLANATIIANSSYDAALVLLLDSGEVVDFLYEEEERYSDIDSFLAGRLASVRESLDRWREHESAARDDWDPERRAAIETRLLDELRRARGESPAVVPPVVAPAANAPMPPAVDAVDLVVGDEEPQASVVLNLVLYLGVYPSPDEVVGCFRAFRRHFPVDGALSWALPAEYGGFPRDAANPDDESWAARMRVDGSGHFGIRLSIEAGVGRRYTLNVRGVPPSDDDGEARRRASFCEVIVPADEDPQRLARLAEELTALLPVRSGHGGYSACVWKSGHRNALYRDIYGWCRRFFALDAGYLDGWLEAMPTRVVGAAWLTVLGPAFAAFLAEHAPARSAIPGTTVTSSPAGVIIRAGDRPTLGDVERGEFPAALAEIDRYLLPLKVGGWHRTSTMVTAGHVWEVRAEELPGGFAEHSATVAWLTRLVEPQRFLALPVDSQSR